MQFSTQWHLRQIALSYLTSIVSFTGALLVWIWILFDKLSQYGLNMYPGLHVPRTFSFAWALHVFREQSLSSAVALLPLALFADILVKRFVWKTGQ